MIYKNGQNIVLGMDYLVTRSQLTYDIYISIYKYNKKYDFYEN